MNFHFKLHLFPRNDHTFPSNHNKRLEVKTLSEKEERESMSLMMILGTLIASKVLVTAHSARKVQQLHD